MKKISYGKLILKKIFFFKFKCFKVGFFPSKFAVKKNSSSGEISCIQFHITSFITWVFLKTINILSLFCSLYDQEQDLWLSPADSLLGVGALAVLQGRVPAPNPGLAHLKVVWRTECGFD